MLQDIISKTKYFILLALMVMPMQAFAGIPFNDVDPIDQTDFGANRLIYFYDTIERTTFIQVTNTTQSFVSIHVQVFNASNNCEEFDFITTLTPGDTNVYDIENLPGNPDFSNSTGFVSISAFDNGSFPLIGMFRIIDSSGYEYRTNAADSEFIFVSNDGFFPEFADYVLNFNDVNGNNLSDVVGIPYFAIDDFQVTAAPFIGAVFGNPFGLPPLIFDEFEFPISCGVSTFACVEGGPFSINKGIDNSIPNSQGFPRICNRSTLNETNGAGWLLMPFTTFVCIDDLDPFGEFCQPLLVNSGEDEVAEKQRFIFDEFFFVGYLGLNNGDGTGSMDSWWGVSFLEFNGIGD